MLLSKEVEVKLAGSNKKYYKSLGYKIPVEKSKGETFYIVTVKIEDVPLKSSVEVNIQCDYCLEQGIVKVFPKKYSDYNKERKVLEKDCCFECRVLKQIEVTELKYGVRSTTLVPDVRAKQMKTLNDNYGDNPFKSEKIMNKRKETNKEKYGVEYVGQVSLFQDKRKETCLEQYGKEYYSQTEECKEKIRQTSQEKYGVNNYFQTKEFKQINKENCIEEYGVENHSQRQDVREKVEQTCLNKYGSKSFVESDKYKEICLDKYGTENVIHNYDIMLKINQARYRNNCLPTSKQQIYLYNLLGGELNYPTQYSNLDIAFPEEMIYLEYDGGGHKLSVLKGNITEEEFKQKEIIRYYSHCRNNWKMIRIISTIDKLPLDEKIIEMIKYAKEYLNMGHSWIKFDIDKNKVISSQGEFNYDYGELRRIQNKDLEEVV